MIQNGCLGVGNNVDVVDRSVEHEFGLKFCFVQGQESIYESWNLLLPMLENDAKMLHIVY